VKIVLIALPLVLALAFVVARAVMGRALPRRDVTVIAAVLLLVYVTITGALGVFWVARMDLPAFDWHYLFGYAVMLLVAVHVALEAKVVLAALRRASPRLPLIALALVVATGIAGGVFLLVRPAEPASVITAASAPLEATSAPAADIVIERGGRQLSVADYLHEQSSYSRTRVLRSPAPAVERPPDVLDLDGEQLALPAVRPRAHVTLDSALAKKLDGNAARIVVSSPLDAARLAELAHYSWGVTSEKARSPGLELRAAASSGALYPIDPFFVVRDVPGVAPGVYYYHPHRHRLVRRPMRVDDVNRALAPFGSSRAALTLLFASTYDRTVHKYGTRSYRYVGLDAGHIATNLSLVARAAGVRCRLEHRFDDEAIARALALDPERGGVILFAECGTDLLDASQLSRAHAPVALPELADDVELTRLSHRMTSWHVLDAPGRATAAAPPAAPTSGTPLPTAEPATRDLFEVVSSRRSVRAYAGRAIGLAQLSSVLSDAVRRRPALSRERLTDVYLLVRAVEGLDPGVYHYEESGHALLHVAKGAVASRVEAAGLEQELLGRAAVVFAFALGSRVGAVDGARDFRSALIETGMFGEGVYLAATARGLGACGVGAFYDDELAKLIGVRPDARVIHLTALGEL
jgi:SagB-type dehydrogenase family enzyme